MSILIYAESVEGKFKKVAFELASYAKKVAESIGTTVTAVVINPGDVSELSKYGVDKVLQVNNDKLAAFSAKAYADAICSTFKNKPAECNQEFQDVTFDPMFGFTTWNWSAIANSGCGQ